MKFDQAVTAIMKFYRHVYEYHNSKASNAEK